MGERYTILDYAKEFKAFYLNKDDSIEESSIIAARRTQMIEKHGTEIVVAIEKCIEYEVYGGSDKFIDFLNNTKKLIISVHNKPKQVYHLIKKWEKESPMELNRKDPNKCIENLTIAMLTKYTYDYIGTVV